MIDFLKNEALAVESAEELIPKEKKVEYDDGPGVEVHFYKGDEEIGKCSTCEFEGKKNAYLHALEVKKKHRRKGYGTRILKHMIDEYGCDVLRVAKSNGNAIRLYKRAGFKQTDEFNDKIITMRR